MSGSGTVPRWTAIRCPAPVASKRADAFLANVLGPLLDGLVAAGEVTAWYLERRAARFVELHVRSGQPALLVARLTGVVCAARAAEAPAADRMAGGRRASTVPTQVTVVGDATFREPDLRCRSTQLALNVIAATPSRAARMHAAFDLAIATTLSLSPDPMAALDRLMVDAVEGGGATLSAVWPRTTWTGAEPSNPGGRWRAVRDAVRDGRGTVGRWAACLHSTPGMDPAGTVGSTALRHLHNQLGLSPGDQHRIYVVLARSLLATSPVRHRGLRSRRPAAIRCAMAQRERP
jgi:hypothetical protein